MPLPAIARAGLRHPWFESNHPFKDGYCHLGCARGEKSLAQNIGSQTCSRWCQRFTGNGEATTMISRPLGFLSWPPWFDPSSIEHC
jgi:hypothetical protein